MAKEAHWSFSGAGDQLRTNVQEKLRMGVRQGERTLLGTEP